MKNQTQNTTQSASFQATEDFARQLDADDPLAGFRSRFLIPTKGDGTELLYLVGHSLGLQPVTTRSAVDEELGAWERLGVDAHFRGDRPWTRYHDIIGPPMGEIVGAFPEEIILMNALTVNLHLMMLTFYRPTKARYKIVMEDHAFPSDRYAVASQIRLHGFDPAEAVISVGPRSGEHTLRTEDIVREINEAGSDVAMVMFGGVNYYTGQYFDLPKIVEAAHEAGAVAGFDLAHAAGNVELRLHEWNVDFAVWCMYKYLNSGPGSLSGCFIHEHQYTNSDLPRLAGWWGEDLEKRFQMAGGFQAAAGAAGWQISNPNVMSLGAIRASLSIFVEAGPARLRAKQRRLTGFLEFLLRQRLGDRIEIITPSDVDSRGSQLSLHLQAGGREVYDQLRSHGIVCDWRNPNVIRAAPVPLYNTFTEVWRFVDVLERICR